jgi:hypothetical protein
MAQAWAQRDYVRKEVSEVLGRLHRLSEEQTWDQQWVQNVMQTVTALQAYVMAAATSFGECRQQTPYAPVKPVINPQGALLWCCEHNPEHCAS